MADPVSPRPRLAASPATSPEVPAFRPALLLAHCQKQLKQMQSVAAKARRQPSVEAVHDLRVGSRRMTEMLNIFGATGLPNPAATRQALAALKELRQQAGAVRDADVMLRHIRNWPPPAGVRPMAQALETQTKRLRQVEAAALRSALAQGPLPAALEALETLLHQLQELTAAPGAGVALRAKMLRRVAQREKALRKRLKRARRRDGPRVLHKARIAAKKLRYAIEVADAAGATGRPADLATLKRVQDDLGTVHDIDVLLERLKKLPRPKNRSAWKAWKESLANRRRKHVEKGRACAKQLARS